MHETSSQRIPSYFSAPENEGMWVLKIAIIAKLLILVIAFKLKTEVLHLLQIYPGWECAAF